MMSLVLLGLISSSSVTANPLAPASYGQLQCAAPNDSAKTCVVLETYRPLGDGKFSDTAEIRVLGTEPPLTITITTIVEVRGEAVCGAYRANEIAAGRVRKWGKPASARETASIRSMYAKVVAPFMNKEFCTTYEETPNGLVTKTTINGVHDPSTDQFVKWVDPSDGYRTDP